MYGLKKNWPYNPTAIFYLWSMLKNKVYSNNRSNENDLNLKIQNDKLRYNGFIFNYIT